MVRFRYTMYNTMEDAIERMIQEGLLSPAARSMDPYDALWQYAEANALTKRELRNHWLYPQESVMAFF